MMLFIVNSYALLYLAVFPVKSRYHSAYQSFMTDNISCLILAM